MDITSIKENTDTDVVDLFRGKVLDWYDEHRRVLPWRALSGVEPNPYHVWLSEIMLQQTTVQAVIPYFLKFVQKWPDVHALASASHDEVMLEWAGLGYYARARNLHKCAKVVSSEYGGVFPSDLKALKSFPGIGDYTSAAIASIAFDKPAVVVDGNIERIFARYFMVDEVFPKWKKTVKKFAALYSEDRADRAGDYAQALMDIGAGVCTPKSPSCSLCPLVDGCKAYANDVAESFPRKKVKAEKPVRYGYVYWCEVDNKILIEKRPDSGLLAGLYGLPTSEWISDKEALQHLAEFHDTDFEDWGVVTHVFTHFNLKLFLFKVRNGCFDEEKYFFVEKADLKNFAFPNAFNKAIKLFL